MFQSILVPLDGSTFGEYALPYAISIARRAGARLELAHVYVTPPVPGAEPALAAEVEKQTRRQAQAYLDGVSQRLASVAPVPVKATLLEGGVVDSLLAHIATTAADLVVLTTHGHGPLCRFWLGSVADELIRRVHRPVLLTRPDEAAPNLAAEPKMSRILIPLDGSSFAEQILQPVMELGQLMHSQYRLLRVVPPVMVAGFDHVHDSSGFMPSLSQIQEADARTYLTQVGERLANEQFTVPMYVATDSQPADAILHDARSHDVDLIALATHGRVGLARQYLGSVADKVVRGAEIAVFIHRPAENRPAENRPA